MTISLHAYVLDQLKAVKGTWPEVARETGIAYGTLAKIACGDSADPGIKKIEALAAYFRSKPSRRRVAS